MTDGVRDVHQLGRLPGHEHGPAARYVHGPYGAGEPGALGGIRLDPAEN